MNIIQSPSPNFSNSRYNKFGIMLHKTLGLMPHTLSWLQNPKAQASAHLLFAKNGDVHELVPLNKRAWSAGRINRPSARALVIALKTAWGTLVKPGHYLVQCEFECLINETFTEEQYKSAVQYFKEKLDFKVLPKNLLTHQDTARDKPDLEKERTEILKRLADPVPVVDKEKIKNQIRELLQQL